jgi:nucleotide-binding universal stress UspA family protein
MSGIDHFMPQQMESGSHPGGRDMAAVPPFRRILLAVSDSTPDSVIELAGSLGASLDAALLVFHAREWLLRGSEWLFGGMLEERANEVTALIRRVDGRLRRFTPRVQNVRARSRHGRVPEAIVDAAREQQVDLIVLALHRPSLLEDLLSPGVVREVERLSDVPVLSVPYVPEPYVPESYVPESCGRDANTKAVPS